MGLFDFLKSNKQEQTIKDALLTPPEEFKKAEKFFATASDEYFQDCWNTSIPMKECIKCYTRKPLTSFYSSKTNKDGKTGKCKDCCKKDVTNRHYKDKQNSLAEQGIVLKTPDSKHLDKDTLATMKTCSKCKAVKSLSLFRRDKRSKTYFRAECRACESARALENKKKKVVMDNPTDFITPPPVNHTEWSEGLGFYSIPAKSPQQELLDILDDLNILQNRVAKLMSKFNEIN